MLERIDLTQKIHVTPFLTLHLLKLSRLKSLKGGIKMIFPLKFAHEYVKMWGASSESWQSNTRKSERAGLYEKKMKKKK